MSETSQLALLKSPSFLPLFITQAIGALPLSWNFLAGEYPKPLSLPSAIHYTNGGPWFDNHQSVDYGGLWTAERDLYLKSIVKSA